MQEIKKIFRSECIYGDIIGFTGISNSRGEEIKSWIDYNYVTNYVVIDDQVSDIINVLGNKRVIKVNNKIGIDFDVVDKALDILF